MPRQPKAPEKLEPINSSDKVKLRLIFFAISIVVIVLALGFIQKTSTNMITHVQDRPKAVAEMVKACGAEAQSKGLKNADAMKYSDECFKTKIAEFDSNSK